MKFVSPKQQLCTRPYITHTKHIIIKHNTFKERAGGDTHVKSPSAPQATELFDDAVNSTCLEHHFQRRATSTCVMCVTAKCQKTEGLQYIVSA